MSFRNRSQAGRRLAEALRPYDGPDVVVIGLARGGVAVAAEVARDLGRPLDAMVVRKIRVPFAPEIAMGAVGEGGVEIIDKAIVMSSAISPEELDEASERARVEATAVLQSIRAERPLIDVSGRTVLLIDDGIATGSTAKVACEMVRLRGARRVVLAVPVGPHEAIRTFAGIADDLVVLETPTPFYAVGSHYDWFPQLTDADVIAFLERAGRALLPVAVPPEARWIEESVTIAVDTDHGPGGLRADVSVPPVPAGVVVFVHGMGSSRLSPRNTRIAGALGRAGIATVLFDLETAAEQRDDRGGIDLGESIRRTRQVVRWARERLGDDVPIGLIGSSTGAAIALETATDRSCEVAAVVSRGGRVDLVGGTTTSLDVPVLLIVGGADTSVLEWNREYASRLRAPHELAVVGGATHLFDEPGTLERATALAVDWFERWLIRAGTPVVSRSM